uniref:Ribonuclease H-like domain-containing protein n=1 Tax=Tanacetum cinerariifolium TaxID=118510 RepID=A0A6L2L0K6_TANCI|nr:ribonuclease H-like domain-containing protein [Tanacetum cinerariifolium]
MADYSLWEVIENGNAPSITKVVEGVETIIAPATAKEKVQRLELKARSTLLMGIPDEHQFKFNSIKDAKSLLQAIEKRFGGNAAIKKTQRNLLKQQYENFTASSSERNKPEVDTLSLDDLYNNLKIYEPEDLQQIHPDDLEEIDLRWQMTMLSIRARRFFKSTGRKCSMNGNETNGFDKSKVECYNCHKRGHFAREYRAPKSQDTKHKEIIRRTVPVETPTSAALVSCDGFSGYDWSIFYAGHFPCSNALSLGYNDVPPPYTGNFMPPKPNLSFHGLEEFVNEHIVSEPTVKKSVVETSEAKASVDNPTVIRKNFGPLLIEDWISDSEDEAESKSKIEKKTVKPSFAKIKFVKSKEQGNPQMDLQDERVIDSGCSRHMTWNMSYLIDYKEIDGRYVAFGGNPKEAKSTGNGTIKTVNAAGMTYYRQLKVNAGRHKLTNADDDAKGVDCLPNAAIFEQLTLTGTMASTIICLAINQKFNFSKYIFESMVKNLDNVNKVLMYPRKPRRKVTEIPQPSDLIEHVADEAVNEDIYDSLERAATTATSLDAVVVPGAKKPWGILLLRLETTKTTKALEIDSLKRRVKKLERTKRSKTYRLKRLYKVGLSERMESSEDEDLGEEDASKQGRIADIDANKDIYLVNVHNDEDMLGVNDLDSDEGTTTTTPTIITGASSRPKAKGLIIHEQEQAPKPTVSSQQPSQVKDKGKGKMVEQEPVKKLSKKDQLMLDEELAFKLQAEEEEEEEEEEKRLAKEKAQQIKKKMKKFYAAKRAKEKRNKPPTRAQQRSIMTKLVLESSKKAKAEVIKGSSKRAGEELEQENAKKQKIEDDKESRELKQCLEIIPDDGDDVTIDATPLSSKSPAIVDYNIHKEGKKSYF